jgi:hypothetical protein
MVFSFFAAAASNEALYWVTPRMYAPCYTPDRPTRTPICPSRVEGPFVVSVWLSMIPMLRAEKTANGRRHHLSSGPKYQNRVFRLRDLDSFPQVSIRQTAFHLLSGIFLIVEESRVMPTANRDQELLEHHEDNIGAGWCPLFQDGEHTTKETSFSSEGCRILRVDGTALSTRFCITNDDDDLPL